MTGGVVRAFQPHCMFTEQLKSLPEPFRQRFFVVCLTEAPLDQVYTLCSRLERRRNQFSEYGIVFRKHFIVARGGQPAIYLYSYGQERAHSRAAVRLFKEFTSPAAPDDDPRWALLPLMNVANERYDFAWEREWRVIGDLKFATTDIMCLLAPRDDKTFRVHWNRLGIPVMAPHVSFEELAEELLSFYRECRAPRYLSEWECDELLDEVSKGETESARSSSEFDAYVATLTHNVEIGELRVDALRDMRAEYPGLSLEFEATDSGVLLSVARVSGPDPDIVDKIASTLQDLCAGA